MHPLFSTLSATKIFAERLGYLFGGLFAIGLYLYSTMIDARADTMTDIPIQFAAITISMLVATIIGTVGSYLAFGEDKKFPPTAASIGHILLGFGAGLFFTRGSLELMGRLDSSENVVIFVSFLWAVGGYFILRLAVAVISSPELQAIMPDWVIRLVGARLPPEAASQPVPEQDNVQVNDPVNVPVAPPATLEVTPQTAPQVVTPITDQGDKS